MRLQGCFLAVLVLVACAGSPSGSGRSVGADPGDAAMSRDLFPFESGRVVMGLGEGRQARIRIEMVDAAHVTLTFEGARPRTVDVIREGSGIFFRNGPNRGTELIRPGARPGDEWEVPEGTVRFVGWERVEVPAGTYDAVRVRADYGVEGWERVNTWWFAPGVGIVRLKLRWGEVREEEMVRISP